jgi:hypothetical protein
MAIWLGEAGGIRLSRTQTDRIHTHLAPSDVDVSAGYCEQSDHR